ncbi:hypothetical protein EOM86_00725 [Candidatus Nomurabacteria bacterium]|nr:hypothetical protein [Candidatus Nomurabacteria bacterium]
MKKNKNRSILAVILCVALTAVLAGIPTLAVEPVVTVTAGANAGSGQLGICDWSSAWGVGAGKGMEVELIFSAPFTDAAAYTRFTDDMAQHVTVNGVDLATRHANDPSLGIDEVNPDLWDGNNMILTNYSEYSLHIIMVGGGTGNLVITETNTIVIAADFPMVSGTLGREIILTFDPASLTWSSSDDPEPTPGGGPLPVNAVTVTADANAGSGQVGMCDWSSAWGIDPGTGMEVELLFSEPFTTAAMYTNHIETLGKYITVNGVNLQTRYAKDPGLGIAEIDPGLWGGQAASLTNYAGNSMHIILVGGGLGNLDITKTNTIFIDDDLPMLNGKPLGRHITLTFDPATLAWSETTGAEVGAAAGAGAGSGQVGMCDWSSAWGIPAGTGMEVEIEFTELFTEAAQYSGHTDVLAKYITVNGVNLANRAAKDPVLGIAEIDPGLWGGNAISITNYGGNQLHLIMVGGGLGNFDITKTNTIYIDDDFPLLYGRPLGRRITLTFDPETLEWSETTPVQVTAEAGAGAGTGQTGMCDWSSAWGIDAGTGMEVEIVLSEDFTADAQYSGHPDLAKYITVNGVNLANRAAKDPVLGLNEIDPGLWGGNAISITNYAGNQLHLIMVGGGLGNLDITKANTIMIDDDMPLLNGKPLGRNIFLSFDPTTLLWSEVTQETAEPTPEPTEGESSETSSHELSREEAVLLTVTAGTPAGAAQEGIWDRSSEWGLDAGKGMVVQLVFSGPFTTAGKDSDLTNLLSSFITLNGVELSRRANYDYTLGMDDIGMNLFEGRNVFITNSSDDNTTKVEIILLGGGTGNLNRSTENTIVLSEDFPLPAGLTLGREITLTYDPERALWTSSLDDVQTSDGPLYPYAAAALIMFAAAAVTIRKRKVSISK